MREAFEPLLQHVADDEAQESRPGRAGSDAFEPLLVDSGAAPAFDRTSLSGQSSAAPASGAFETNAGTTPDARDAAGLQSMLADAFSPPTDVAAKAPLEADPAAAANADPESGSSAQLAAPHAEPAPAERDAVISGLEAEIAALKQAHAAEIARLTEQALPTIADQVAAAVKGALGPLLAHPVMAAVEAAAVDRFCAELAAIVRSGEAVRVQLSGPQALLDTVRAQWPEALVMPDFQAAEQPELVAIADEQVLSTRLSDLRSLLLGDSQ